jgi:hypothetical protein
MYGASRPKPKQPGWCFMGRKEKLKAEAEKWKLKFS